MRLHDVAFVALVAFGSGWTLAAIGLEILAASDDTSVLWTACSRFFLGLACVSFAVAFARRAWRARHALLKSRGLAAAAVLVVALPLVSLSFGHVMSAWFTVAVALGSSFAFPSVRIGDAS